MTRAKKLKPRDRVLKALEDSRRDPEKTGNFLKEVAASWLTFGGRRIPARPTRPGPEGSGDRPAKGQPPRKHEFCLLSLKNQGQPAAEVVSNHGAVSNHETTELVPLELVPFYLSPNEAKEQIKELKTGKIFFNTARAGNFFNQALQSGQTPCLFPGTKAARTFSAEEMREVIRLAERPKIPPHTKTKAWKGYLRLKYAYALESAAKAALRQPSPVAPPTLAKFLIMAEHGLKAQLSFQAQFKKSFLTLQDRGDENFIELAWNMLWSLAHVYHIFHFSGKDYPPEGFLEETGLAVAPAVLPTEPPEKIKSAVLMIFDPKKKEGLRIYFTVPERKQKIMLLEAGQTQGCGHRPQTP
jgi:hypothetical protein